LAVSLEQQQQEQQLVPKLLRARLLKERHAPWDPAQAKAAGEAAKEAAGDMAGAPVPVAFNSASSTASQATMGAHTLTHACQVCVCVCVYTHMCVCVCALCEIPLLTLLREGRVSEGVRDASGRLMESASSAANVGAAKARDAGACVSGGGPRMGEEGVGRVWCEQVHLAGTAHYPLIGPCS